MNLKHYYWYFKDAVPLRICDDIIKYGNQQKKLLAVTGPYQDKKLSNKEVKDLKTVRDSNIVWLNDPWIYAQIHPYVFNANRNAGWNFQWDWSESCQFTKYGKNQFYDWHNDGWNQPYGEENPDPNLQGKVRKLSVTVSLSDGKDYKGGELEFDFRSQIPKKNKIIKCKEILTKGSLVVFPSFVWHRVCPITKGERYSLVIWNVGRPFQ